jgi:hypothetical protein
MNVTLSVDDIAMIVDALDCYEYWELGPQLPHNNGAVFLPGDFLGARDPYWTESPTEDEAEAIDAIQASRALASRLSAVTAG